jgi:hypothetical protein
MISCIEWIPRNVADPNPKRYELSKAERELLEQGEREEHDNNEEEDFNDDNSDMIDDIAQVQVPEEGNPSSSLTATQIIASQKIDPSSLPKELRMDEYSDDDEENDGHHNHKQSNIGDLLIGNEDFGTMGIDEDGKVEDIDIGGGGGSDDNDGDYDEEDDDDLADVPDTREYVPTDIKGLEAMNFGGYTGMNDFEEGDEVDDDSDVEDTNLKPDDALIIVAKTEEVRCFICIVHFTLYIVQCSVDVKTFMTLLIPSMNGSTCHTSHFYFRIGFCIVGNLCI